MNFKTKTTTLILSIFAILTFAQNKNLYHKIDSLIKLQNPTLFNGVILISKNGKTKYSNSNGFINYITKKPLSLSNQFELMSNTKQITAVLILREVEKGKINLQKPIGKYLDSLNQSWKDSVTVHQLLNHTHGISDTEKPLLFKPGTDFKYGNLSNILLGKILEKINGKPYSEQAESLFKELKMNQTFCFSNTERRNLVYGHTNKENAFSVVEKSFINENNMPADGVISTAEDLAIWNQKLHNGKILKPETYKLMTTSSTMSQHDVFGKGKMGYGYNIRIVNDKGLKYFGHTGLGDGFASLNIYVPQEKLSLIILENQMNEDGSLYYYYETLIKDLLIRELHKKNYR